MVQNYKLISWRFSYHSFISSYLPRLCMSGAHRKCFDWLSRALIIKSKVSYVKVENSDLWVLSAKVRLRESKSSTEHIQGKKILFQVIPPFSYNIYGKT